MEIAFTMPEGVTKAVRLIDVLPAGLRFVPGTATLRRNSTALAAANNPGSINSDGGGTPGDQVAVTPTGGNLTGEIVFDLGDVTNAAMSNGTDEIYTLRLSAVVANSSGNNAGTASSDRGRIRFADGNGAQMLVNSSVRSVHVAEPRPAIDKIATPAAPLGGPVTFVVTVANSSSGANAATGFEWNVTDALPAGYENPMLVAVDLMGSGAVVAPCGFTLNVLSCDIDALDPGEAVKITYTADIGTAAVFGQTITNTASAKTSSLPDANGTGICTATGGACTMDADCGPSPDMCQFAPGAPGTTDGERNASGGPNDLSAADPAMVVIDTPSIDKTTLRPRSFYAIGDMPTFQITVAVPQGSTNSLFVEDTLPAGLSYKAGTAMAVLPAGVTARGGLSGPLDESTVGFLSQAGSVLTFDFADVVAAAAGDVLITYQVTVDNIPSNQDGRHSGKRRGAVFRQPGESVRSAADRRSGHQHGGGADRRAGSRAEQGHHRRRHRLAGGGHDLLPDRADQHRPYHRVPVRLGRCPARQRGGARRPRADHQPGAVGERRIGGAQQRRDDPLSSGDLVCLDHQQYRRYDRAAGLRSRARRDRGGHLRRRARRQCVAGAVLDNVTPSPTTASPPAAPVATTASAGAVDDDDTDLDNYGETASQSLTVLTDIAIDKTVSPTTFTVGEDVTYTIRVDFIEGVTESLRVTDILARRIALPVAQRGGRQDGDRLRQPRFRYQPRQRPDRRAAFRRRVEPAQRR